MILWQQVWGKESVIILLLSWHLWFNLLEMHLSYIEEDIDVCIWLLCWSWQVLLTIFLRHLFVLAFRFPYWQFDTKMHLDNDIWQYCSLINWAISVSHMCWFECIYMKVQMIIYILGRCMWFVLLLMILTFCFTVKPRSNYTKYTKLVRLEVFWWEDLIVWRIP